MKHHKNQLTNSKKMRRAILLLLALWIYELPIGGVPSHSPHALSSANKTCSTTETRTLNTHVSRMHVLYLNVLQESNLLLYH